MSNGEKEIIPEPTPEESTNESAPEEIMTASAPEELTVLEKLKGVVGEAKVSDSELERIIYSGDPSSLPQFHYRWKGKYLADYAVRVANVNEIEGILKIAREYNIPVIPRGGASSCMCSSSPTRGGITLDIKPMNKILEINKDDMSVRVEPGVTFEALENDLEKHDLTLGIYPSSAKSAVIGGWIGCGGRGGIGTAFYGGLKEHIISLSVIGGDGSIEVLEGEDINLFLNSYGILGVIFEIKLKIHEKVREYKSFSYGFRTIDGLCNTLVEISTLETKPVYLKIADSELQKYSNPLETGKYVLSVTYIDVPSAIPAEELKSITGKHNGVYINDEFSKKEWDLRYDCEFNPKEHIETLMFQEFWIPIEKVFEMLSAYEKYRRSHKIPALWFGMLGTQNEMRLELMVMIDAAQYLKFISSKGILHKMMKKAIKIGGAPYTIGLQNSIYMSRAYPERMKEMQEAKEKWDPSGIMNPDRVTSCLTSFRRIDFLFLLATAFRRLSKYIGE
ncbi:FAD-binding oxidoreductase [Candidatus Thorarchaeota archaeon]|nr:MAG: FAD-binding oxidoreductase [Candidatus Thorarchaeota archaeon]